MTDKTHEPETEPGIPAPDPGNAPPAEWTKPLSQDEADRLTRLVRDGH